MLRKVNYKIESYISTNKISEIDIFNYYITLGYRVYSENIRSRKSSMYSRRIKSGKLIQDDNIINLFNKYSSGYPDLLLIKDNKISFIEIKLDNDSLRPNQIVFLEELSLIADVTVVYINKEGVNVDGKIVDITREIIHYAKSLRTIQMKKGYKPQWIIAKVYEKYKDELLKSDVLKLFSKEISISKKNIISFVNYINNKKEITINLDVDQQKRLDKIKNKKKIILKEYGIYEFPDWANSLTIEEILDKLNKEKNK